MITKMIRPMINPSISCIIRCNNPDSEEIIVPVTHTNTSLNTGLISSSVVAGGDMNHVTSFYNGYVLDNYGVNGTEELQIFTGLEYLDRDTDFSSDFSLQVRMGFFIGVTDTFIVGQYDITTSSFDWGVYQNAAGRLTLSFFGTTTVISPAGNLPTEGEPYDLIITRSGNNFYANVNGVVTTWTQTAVYTSVNNFKLLASWNSEYKTFGELYTASIWNRAITSLEVADLVADPYALFNKG